MAGYTRQSAASIVTSLPITAAIFNAEFNQLQSAFGVAGHTHDGTAGNAPKIDLTTSVTSTLPIANGGTNAATASAARTSLGLAIGTDVQGFDADLDALAANSTDGFWAHTGAGTGAARTLTAPASGFTITNPAGIAGNPTFVLANDLAALEGLSSNGIVTRTNTDTMTTRTITGPAEGITVTNGSGVSGNPTLALANDLAALESLSTNGLIARTNTDTMTTRTITGTANEITVTNGNGVSGDPTLSLPVALTFTGKTITGGTFNAPSIAGPILALTQSANPTPTVQGIVEWDTDDNHFAVGNGSTTVKIGKVPTVQTFAASSTWTKPTGCRYVFIDAVGGGGGSGGAKGAGAGNAGSTGGGGSGFYGMIGPISVVSVGSSSVTIGAGGTGGNSAVAGSGTNGGNTAITLNATTYTWGGGSGSPGYLANPNGTAGAEGGAGGVGTNVTGGSQHGDYGVKDGTAGAGGATGGNGGSNPLGTGGQGAHTTAVNGVANGNAGVGFGAGGGGSVTNNAGGNADGVSGSGGFMRIWEYY